MIRFPRFVVKLPSTDGCWEWNGGKTKRGYGVFGLNRDGRKMVMAHDYALELRIGRRLRNGEWGLHTCDNPPCVRNDGDQETYVVDGISYVRFGHLWIGDHAANMADMQAKGRGSTGESHSIIMRASIPRGQDARHSKLTDAMVREIRRRWALRDPNRRRMHPDDPNSTPTLAREFGVSTSTVYAIGNREIWNHPEDVVPH